MKDVTTSFATTLADEWARNGIEHAVIAPGSRSTPLALALVRDGRFAVHVVLDERSAAFRALGIGLASGKPAILLCTSGTAAVNFHPAVVEAAHARVPMIVATADRPPELRDSGAGQTIDQSHLYGTAARWYCDPGPPEELPDAAAVWRTLACRVVAEAADGPVHLNLPFREPLVPTGAPLVDAPGRNGGAPWIVTTRAPRVATAETVKSLAARVRAHPDGVLVAGWGARVSPATAQRFATAAGWAILADPISQLRTGDRNVSTYEALLRAGALAPPSFAVRVGAPLTSKLATAWLDSGVPQVVVTPDDVWLDPHHAASERIVADPDALLRAVAEELGVSAPPSALLDLERRARDAIDKVLDAPGPQFEGRIARDLAAVLPDGAALVVASSLPVRALEWCMAPRDGLRIFSNRGANGIDGFVSTVFGIATAHPGPVVALTGDLCFLHDVNGLASNGAPATFVVIDNDGGGIFSFLAQNGLPEFETLFGTPHGLDLVAVARARGVPAERVDDLSGLKDAIASGETRVLVVPVDRAASVERHRALWDAVRSG